MRHYQNAQLSSLRTAANTENPKSSEVARNAAKKAVRTRPKAALGSPMWQAYALALQQRQILLLGTLALPAKYARQTSGTRPPPHSLCAAHQ